MEIVHQCAWMNCCTEVDLSAAWADGVVELTETETGGECFREAYFSPVYQVGGLGAGTVEFVLGGLGVTVDLS